MSTNTETNFLDMPDEDVANLSSPPTSAAPVVPDPSAPGEGEPAGSTPPVEPVAPAAPDPLAADDTPPAPPAAVVEPPASGEGAPPVAAGDGEGKLETNAAGGEQPPAAIETPPTNEPDFGAIGAELTKRLQAGIKANGRLLKIQSVEDAERLIQMGAGATRKMQELAPALRIVKMLSNNNLMDESKIAFLIDLDQKNPDAIQKLLADSEFDPLSADKAKASSYQPGDHRVSDAEMQFQSAVDAAAETPEGIELLTEIQQQWDGQSKQALLQDPSIVTSLTQQRSNGIYKLITDEIDRLTVLGHIPPGTPFLQAYRGVGDMLHTQGRLVPNGVKTDPPPSTPAAPAAPAAAVVPAATPPAAAFEAAPVRATTSKPASTTPAYLDMPDDAFLKMRV